MCGGWRGVWWGSGAQGVRKCIPHSNEIKTDLHLRFEDRRRWEERTKAQLTQVVNQHESEVAEALTTYVAEAIMTTYVAEVPLSLLVRLFAMSYCGTQNILNQILYQSLRSIQLNMRAPCYILI